MEKLAMKEWLEELFDSESIDDMVLKGVPRKEAEEMEGVAISFQRYPKFIIHVRQMMMSNDNI